MSRNESPTEQRRQERIHRLSRRSLLATTATGIAATTLADSRSAFATQQAEATATPEQGLALPLYPHGQPLFLDPHRATNWGPHWILLPHVWAGPLRFDELGGVTNDLATSVEPDQTGQVWTVELRSEATFASGNPVTADALVAGWMRALDPQHLAPMAQFMARVEGYSTYVSGESQDIGFEVVDEQTVAIHLASPYAHFPEELATFVWAAVDVATIEDVPGSQVPFADAGAGRWRFVASDDAAVVNMVSIDTTNGDAPSGFTSVAWRTISGPDSTTTALSLFEAGELVIADVPAASSLADEQTAPIQDLLTTIEPSGSTMLIGMDFNQAPFDDIRVRQAVAASIDRDAWATEIQGGDFTAATSITPPVLASTANYQAPSPIEFDPDRAKSLLADAGIDDSNQPPVTWYLSADASTQENERANALLEMIKTNSGLAIELDTTLTVDQIQSMRVDNDGLQFDLRWWWPFTNSPSGLYDLAAAESPVMAGWFNWSAEFANEAVADAAELFNTLMTDVRVNMDQTQRLQAYAEAEKILIDNAIYIPLGHGVQRFIQSAALTGTRQGAFSGYAPIVLDGDVTYVPDNATPTSEG